MRLQPYLGTVFACVVVVKAQEPCAQVSALVVPMRAANPNGMVFLFNSSISQESTDSSGILVTPVIPGDIAFKCLQSVPLHSDEALAVTGSLLPYVQFQSGKNPPEIYPQLGVNE